MSKKIFKIGVCEGRHEMPQVTDGFVFGQEVNPLDVEGLEEQAYRRFRRILREASITSRFFQAMDVQPNLYEHGGCRIDLYDATLWLYATGLTVAVIAAIKGAAILFREVIVMHYDRETGDYYPQELQSY